MRSQRNSRLAVTLSEDRSLEATNAVEVIDNDAIGMTYTRKRLQSSSWITRK
jgi:hypothetical protein